MHQLGHSPWQPLAARFDLLGWRLPLVTVPAEPTRDAGCPEWAAVRALPERRAHRSKPPHHLLLTIFQTSSCKVLRARRTSSRRNCFSFSGGRSGLPVGLTMPPEGIARSEPTSLATGIMVQICVTGIFSFSISLLIAAPQRVLEPQVEVRITPVTPASFNRPAMSRPIRVAFSTAAWAPPVE
jgi:hypothetical protein